ncbi:hypothetical protein FRC07_003549 [Ceratobasidium sp. 392]|nr:hypothetical protein FRC07_003549 [Ceratobasidium sp. 392]
MHPIFETPELVSVICASLHPSAMLVSKHFFHGMLPYQWKGATAVMLFTRGLIPANVVLQQGMVRAVINLPPLDISLTDQALTQLTSKSPNIRELECCPRLNPLPANGIPPQTFYPLSQFHSLYSLTSNTAIVQPGVLELIGRLPKLANLKIKGGYGEPRLSFPLHHQLPASSFPSLLALDIGLSSSEEVKRFWELVPLRMLTTVHICVDPPGGVDFVQYIPSLCSGSPLIRKLVLYADVSDEDNEQTYGVQADMAEHLWQLPLDSTFSLVPAKFDFDGVWAKIAMFWPNLREIYCINQTMRLEDLMILSANLPNLRKLECNFDVIDMIKTVEHNWQPVGRPPFYPSLEKLVIMPFELTDLASADCFHNLDDSARYAHRAVSSWH